MKKYFTTGNVIITCCALLIAARFGFLIKVYHLFGNWLGFVFTDTQSAFRLLDFSTADHFLSALLIVVIPALVFIFRKSQVIAARINYTNLIIICIFFVFTLAPLITRVNPEFQKNISVTKLLPPFSKVKMLRLKESTEKQYSNIFQAEKNTVVARSFDDNLLFVDSIKEFNDKVFFYQSGAENSLEKSRLVLNDKKSIISKRLFILGSDEFGRDIFSRMIYGARVSLSVGFGAVVIAFFIGSLLGFFAGYSGKWIDILLNRIAEMFLTVPSIFFVILILALFGNNIFSVVFVLGFSGWMSLFKLVRSEIFLIKKKDFFISAGLLGLKKSNLFFKEILPVIIVPVVVNLIFQFGNVVLAESALSFLGLGVGNSFPSWGSMIDSGKNYITTAWWLILFPGLALFTIIFAVNSVGKKISSSITQIKY
ncbi:MAG: ABC transporter permease [Ignavibacteriaceae bacterium]|nr:ABC transporter permease [Ignavibacteriaceae bacterium]